MVIQTVFEFEYSEGVIVKISDITWKRLAYKMKSYNILHYRLNPLVL